MLSHFERAEAKNDGHVLPRFERGDVESADQCTMGLNFATLRPRQEILADYVHILERIYDPVAFTGRLQRLAKMLANSGRKQQTRAQLSRRGIGRLEMLHRVISNLPEPRDLFRRTLSQCVASNSDSTSRIVLLMALYLDVGPFSRDVAARIDKMMAALDPVVEPRVRIDQLIPTLGDVDSPGVMASTDGALATH